MTNCRTTTFEERVQAVMDCIQNGKDYQIIMKTHRVSYQQIYSWVRKLDELRLAIQRYIHFYNEERY